MKSNIGYLFICLILFTYCKKEEPFEYPEDPVDPQPELIVEMSRVMKGSEMWEIEREVEGCNPNVSDQNLAISEVNDAAGQALIQLVPSEEGCALSLEMKSAINANEISSRSWDELTFEFTFSEYGSTDGTKFPLFLYYKDLEMELDLAHYINTLVGNDNSDGLLKMWFENGNPSFTLNGISFNPDFDKEGNHFSLNGKTNENFVGFGLSSDGSPEQSFAVSQFLRITRFGVED